MVTTTESIISGFSINNKDIVFSELGLVQNALEKLFESDDAKIPEEDVSEFRAKVDEIVRKTAEAETIEKRIEIYLVEYHPISQDFKEKYQDFLSQDILRGIETAEKQTDTLIIAFKSLVSVQEYILATYREHPPNSLGRAEGVHRCLVVLSELIEEYSISFSFTGCLKEIEEVALAVLEDPDLKPNSESTDEEISGHLVAIKNTARSILWQIKEARESIQENPPANDHPLSPEMERRLQIEKNQAAMKWAKSRLEELERIGQAKGFKY